MTPRAGRMGLFHLAPFRNAYLIRGLFVWGLVRLGLAFVSAQDPSIPPDQALPAEVGILAVVAVAVWLDARRRGEDLFLANLGIPGWAIAIAGLPAAFVLEVLVP